MKRIGVLIVVCLVCTQLTGCILTSREFNDVEDAIRKQVNLKTKVKFGVGPVMLSTANIVIKSSTKNEEPVSEYVEEIHKVQVGVYELKSSQHVRIPQEAEQQLTDRGWESFVRVRDDNEQVSLLYKQVNNRILSLYAIVLSKDQLVIVEVQGRVDNLIEKVIQEHGLPFQVDSV